MKKIAAVLCMALALCLFDSRETFAAEKESAFDRVMRTGVLRCGYQSYPPVLSKNLQTGKMEGIYPEIFEEMAKQAGIKIEWTEEAGSDTIFTSLDAGRFDAFCSPVTYTPARAKVALFTRPFVYVPFYVYVAGDDTRFDQKNAYEKMNSEAITFQVKDGDLIAILADQFFPKAKKAASAGLTEMPLMMMAVAGHKVDAIVGEPIYAGAFMRSNPGKIKRAGGADVEPLNVFPATAAVAMGEHDLHAFLDTALQGLVEGGFVRQSIARHVENGKDLFTPAKSYEVTK